MERLGHGNRIRCGNWNNTYRYMYVTLHVGNITCIWCMRDIHVHAVSHACTCTQSIINGHVHAITDKGLFKPAIQHCLAAIVMHYQVPSSLDYSVMVGSLQS